MAPYQMIDVNPSTDGRDLVLRPRIALALSGGGFRASLFHLGVLRRLAEACWLSKVDVISSVSGGSVVGAFASLRWADVIQDGATVAALERHIVQPFLAIIRDQNFLRSWAIRIPIVPFRKLLDRSYTRSSLAADLFGSWFCGRALCTDLPDTPYVVLNASNLVSGRAWRFTRHGLGDSRLGYSSWNHSPLHLGFAVGASAGFPPVFPPVRIVTANYDFSGPIYGETPLPSRQYIPLSDGGVYDNMGTEVLTKPTHIGARALHPAEFLVVSDGGYPARQRFRASGLPALSEALLLYRVDEIARDQVSALRRRMLIRQFQAPGELQGALAVLGSSISRLPASLRQLYIDAVGASSLIPPALLARIHAIRTHLNAFTPEECEALMYHGYTLFDAALWAHESAHPEAYLTPHPGSWRIKFTPNKIREWEAGLQP